MPTRAARLALLRIAADAAAAGDELGTDASFGGDPSQVDTDADDRHRYAEWSGRLLGGLPDDELREEHESERFTGELRHYQRRGLGWMRFLARLGLGGCLADDMGLGKTATTLAHLVERPGRHLVVCPLSVVHNWETESARFTPSLAVTVHHGSSRSLGSEGQSRARSTWVSRRPTASSSSPRTACSPTTSSTCPRSSGPPSCSTRRSS